MMKMPSKIENRYLYQNPKEEPSNEKGYLHQSLTREPKVQLPPSLLQELDAIEERTIRIHSIGSSSSNKMLFLTANPVGTANMRSGEEYRQIQFAINTTLYRQNFALEYCGATQIEDIPWFLSTFEPRIVHLACHGNDENQIMLEDDSGQIQPVPLQSITNMIGGLSKNRNIQCVYLNTCYSKELAEELSKYIGCTIGIAGEIEDRVAIRVAKVFYHLIGNGETISRAYDIARWSTGNNYDTQKFHIFSTHSSLTDVTMVENKLTSSNRLHIKNPSCGLIEITLPGDLLNLPPYMRRAAENALITELANRLSLPMSH